MLKEGIIIHQKRGLIYTANKDGSERTFKPWLGDSFSFLYDFIMKRSIFPKKFDGDIDLHGEILLRELQNITGKRILELATGSGSAAKILPADNSYTGTDISPGLLKKAIKSFTSAGFTNAEFYVSAADDLPFSDNSFDVILCILALNFFENLDPFLAEMKRVALPGVVFICCVPVPERNQKDSTIRGTLRTEGQLKSTFEAHDFAFESLPVKNGALLYFKAHRTIPAVP